jgi:hypothetical protein
MAGRPPGTRAWFARSMNGVLVGPGARQLTRTPLPLSSAWSASEKERTKALVAP